MFLSGFQSSPILLSGSQDSQILLSLYLGLKAVQACQVLIILEPFQIYIYVLV